MTYQASDVSVLVSALEAEPDALVSRMGITGNAVVVNQAEKRAQTHLATESGSAVVLESPERGVGISRNEALLHCRTSLCLFSDDDVAFVANYAELVAAAFEALPRADIIVFNLTPIGSERTIYQIRRQRRIGPSAIRFGTPRIAAKVDRLRQTRMSFSQLFGGGAVHSAGEDSLFMRDALVAGLRIYQVPIEIGSLDFAESTWFEGFGARYLYDRGALYASVLPRAHALLSAAFLARHRRKFLMPVREAAGLMREGARSVGSPIGRKS